MHARSGEYVVWFTTTADPGVRVGVAQASAVEWSEQVNADTSMTVTTPLYSGHPDLASIEPGATLLWLVRDGVPVAAPVWIIGAQLDLAGETVAWSGVGLMAYFDRRLVTTAISHAAVDVLQIAREVITACQAKAGGNIGLLTGAELAGVTRDLAVPVSDHERCGDLFRSLAEEDGFDWRIVPAYAGEDLTATLELTYPEGGTATDLTITNGTQIDLTSIEWDATETASTVIVLGGGNGPAQPSATSTVDPANRPLTERLETATDITDTGVLAALAAHISARTSTPAIRPAGRYRPHPDVGVGKIRVGSVVRLVADAGPLTIDGDYRITSQTVTISTDGTETVDVEFAPAGLFL